MNCTPTCNSTVSLGGGGAMALVGPWVKALMSAMLTTMCVLGVAGNLYVLAITRSAALLRASSMYVYIVNLALADLLYLATVPFVVCTYFAEDWLFGVAGCRVLLSLDLLTTHASVFNLVAMSLDRYRAVARPFSAHKSSAGCRKVMAGAMWVVAFALTLPMMVMIRQKDRKPNKVGKVDRVCFPTWTLDAYKAYLTVLFFTSVLVPGLVIGGLYVGLVWHYRARWAKPGWGSSSAQRRGPKQKVVSMSFVIVLAYWACFLPFWVWQLAPTSLKALTYPNHEYVNYFVTSLTYGNSCINPLLYTLLTRNYKDYLAWKAQSSVQQGLSCINC